MVRNVIEYLEIHAKEAPEQELYEDIDKVFNFGQVQNMTESMATGLARQIQRTKEPVAVFMDKNVESVVVFLSIVSSGNFYCPLDSKMPVERIQVILDVLKPCVILTDKKHQEQAEGFAGESKVLLMEELLECDRDFELLHEIRAKQTEDDPLYVLFTSGSTGVPKGVLVSHRVVINYLEWLEKEYHMDHSVIFGNQAPFYFDVSVHDIYGALYFGTKMVIIPKTYFSFPVRLLQFLNEKKISAFLWVPSAMGIIANLKAFRELKPEYLKYIMFAGEVLPRKQLDYWRSNLPDAVYANLYGPTETYVCTAYTCTGMEPEGTTLPIGKPIANSEALILDEEGHPVPYGEKGELCMRGSCLALGYYENPEKTVASFTQNPLHSRYPDRIYHTGDLVHYDENGDLIYVSRKDFQIKHMGYRIELGEIEAAANYISEVNDCACTYDSKRKRIQLFYDGTEINKKDMLEQLANRIPEYMIPGKIVYMRKLPHNANGKIDRKALQES